MGIDSRKIGHFIGQCNSIMRFRSPKIIWATSIFFYDIRHWRGCMCRVDVCIVSYHERAVTRVKEMARRSQITPICSQWVMFFIKKQNFVLNVPKETYYMIRNLKTFKFVIKFRFRSINPIFFQFRLITV